MRRLFAFVLFMSIGLPAHAVVLSFFDDPDAFGDLNQHDTLCGNVACGPTAAVNSFVFLENTRPDLYDSKLIPHTNGNTFYQDEIDVGNVLGTSTFMFSCDLCNTEKQGTFIEEFIIGKQKYINSVAPGTTTFEAQTTFAWRPLLTDGYDAGAKPGYVQDNTAPTLDFLYTQLAKGQDVELFINFTGGNHYITLTGISYDTLTNTGSIDFIDPDNGGPATASILGLDPNDNDILLGGYLVGANIVNAVAESPIPEPASLAVLAAGLIGFGVVRQRRRKTV